VSQSPTEASETGDAGDVYASAWTAINKLMRRGYSWSGRERNCAFLNVGDGTYARIDAVSGFGFYDDARAASRIDWDLDGDLDLFVTNRNGPRVRFLRNDAPRTAGDDFVAFRLKGVTCNRDAIGARVDLFLASGRKLVRSLRAGEGYLAQSSSWMHFGLGAERELDRVVVRWPGGEAESFGELEAGLRYDLIQGSGRAVPWDPPRTASALEPSPRTPPDPTSRTRVVLPVPLPMPRLVTETPAGRTVEVYGIQPGQRSTPTGSPALLTLWASWCTPCLEELTALAARHEQLAAAGVALVAIGVEPEEERVQAEARLKDLGWPRPVVFAPAATIDVLDTLQGLLMDRDTRIPLPTSMLVDGDGNLVVMYFGPVDVDVLLADLALLEAAPKVLRAAASPFEGDWGRVPAQLDFALIEARFASRGLEDTAREYQLGNMEVRAQRRPQLLYERGCRAGKEGRLDEAVAYLRQAIEADPRFAAAWRELGVTLYRQGEFRAAIVAYEKVLALEPDHLDTHLYLGLAHVAVGEKEKAEGELERLIEAGYPRASLLAEYIGKMKKEEGD